MEEVPSVHGRARRVVSDRVEDLLVPLSRDRLRRHQTRAAVRIGDAVRVPLTGPGERVGCGRGAAEVAVDAARDAREEIVEGYLRAFGGTRGGDRRRATA